MPPPPPQQPVPAQQPESVAPPPSQPSPSANSRLVAPEAAAAAGASVETLMRTLASERNTAVQRGGPTIEVAPYHMFGSAEMAEAVIETLDGRFACLMANHGQIALAPSLARALAIAEQVEEQAGVYWGTLAIGGPSLLTGEQMDDITSAFRGYGQPRRSR